MAVRFAAPKSQSICQCNWFVIHCRKVRLGLLILKYLPPPTSRSDSGHPPPHLALYPNDAIVSMCGPPDECDVCCCCPGDLTSCLCGACCASCCLAGAASDRDHDRHHRPHSPPPGPVYVQPVFVQGPPPPHYHPGPPPPHYHPGPPPPHHHHHHGPPGY